MPAGRPSKYTPELQEKADQYLHEWSLCGDVVPSQVGLSDYLDLCTTTIENWSKDEDKPEFLWTLKRIEAKQHQVTLNNGLKGEFSSPITKLVLHNHGYSDKSQSEFTGKDGAAIQVDTEWRIRPVAVVTKDA